MQLAKALRDAGIRPSGERLREIATEALTQFPKDWTSTQTTDQRGAWPQTLRSIAVEAMTKNARNWDGARDHVFNAVRNDAALLWELFQPYRALAVQKLLTDTAQEMREATRPAQAAGRTNARETAQGGGRTTCGNQQGGAPSRPSTAGMAAVANIARLSLLDTLKIEGRAIGEWGVGEARSWARRTGINVRFVEMLTANLPLEDTIGRWVKPDEADEIWKRAQETQNAA